MERLISYKSECKREMICRYEDCDTCEEYCPHLNEDNCPCLQEVLEKLAEYEDLEEQGKLMKLPCTVGDTVYRINTGKKEPIIPMLVIGIAIRNENELVIQTKDIEDDGHNLYSNNSIGKTVFFTREEAEAALKAREENHAESSEQCESFESQRLFSKACSYDNAIQIAKSIQIAKGGNT